MDVIEATRELGKAIQQDERYIKYMLCKEKNDSDESLQHLIGECNLLRIQINNEFSKEDGKDDEKVKELNAKLRECYDEIMKNENMAEFDAAKRDIDALISKVNGIITLCVEGHDPMTAEPPEGCTGSCSSCGGCH